MLNSDYEIRDYDIPLFDVVIPIFYAVQLRDKKE